MAFNASKTLLLEKQYVYVRASKGFELEGISTERIWTNTGYYRFLTQNIADALGNSYVTIHYDNSDTDFIAYCSDLFLEEIQNSVTVAVENIQSVVEDFAETNHEDIDTLSANLGNALNLLAKDTSVQPLKDSLIGSLTPSSTNNLYTRLTNILNAIAGGNTGSELNNILLLLKNCCSGHYFNVLNNDDTSTINVNLANAGEWKAYFVSSSHKFHHTGSSAKYIIEDSFGNSVLWATVDGDFTIDFSGIYFLRRVK